MRARGLRTWSNSRARPRRRRFDITSSEMKTERGTRCNYLSRRAQPRPNVRLRFRRLWTLVIQVDACFLAHAIGCCRHFADVYSSIMHDDRGETYQTKNVSVYSLAPGEYCVIYLPWIRRMSSMKLFAPPTTTFDTWE